MVVVNAMGEVCPVPVVMTLKAAAKLSDGGTIETRVDNEVAVQNLMKMAQQKGYVVSSERIGDKEHRVKITIPARSGHDQNEEAVDTREGSGHRGIVAVISAGHMGSGDDKLGAILLKGFIYALSQQAKQIDAVLLYNGGVKLACSGSDSIEDLKALEDRGCAILSCGTCLDCYGLTAAVEVGGITNMYEIVDRQLQADLIVRP
ncbi:selenium metabolism protein YedF [Coriobacterium glomerans PW2]|uniref:Selenium metabolism protein YedF n=1 Tax=Coriobacterium glomerans (strain ATCC 49209 / DSM 20642 / JCM 10262 / PW2) TaxID=700015 RepID=F2N8F8_CORGP|nr:sulfurtransferase-like selenium metabolism protein YedF [Coriobacterium glomerans]AEB07341.1 selenium metabolism protein YedF [Coriobacterium glomerans PW2]